MKDPNGRVNSRRLHPPSAWRPPSAQPVFGLRRQEPGERYAIRADEHAGGRETGLAEGGPPSEMIFVTAARCSKRGDAGAPAEHQPHLALPLSPVQHFGACAEGGVPVPRVECLTNALPYGAQYARSICHHPRRAPGFHTTLGPP